MKPQALFGIGSNGSMRENKLEATTLVQKYFACHVYSPARARSTSGLQLEAVDISLTYNFTRQK